jgi:hypothetical protein
VKPWLSHHRTEILIAYIAFIVTVTLALQLAELQGFLP